MLKRNTNHSDRTLISMADNVEIVVRDLIVFMKIVFVDIRLTHMRHIVTSLKSVVVCPELSFSQGKTSPFLN